MWYGSAIHLWVYFIDVGVPLDPQAVSVSDGLHGGAAVRPERLEFGAERTHARADRLNAKSDAKKGVRCGELEPISTKLDVQVARGVRDAALTCNN